MVVGTFLNVPNAKSCALLLHMMPADRSSWADFQSALAERGISSLAIDLRGHGESTVQDGRNINYRNFSDQQHQAAIEDVRSALSWLGARGFPTGHVAIVGASIGANLALQAASEQTSIPAVALLSPGEDYHGVRTYYAVEKLQPSQAVWAAGSQGDDDEAYQAAQQITKAVTSTEKLFMPFASAGHGTYLFRSHPGLMADLAGWLSERLS